MNNLQQNNADLSSQCIFGRIQKINFTMDPWKRREPSTSGNKPGTRGRPGRRAEQQGTSSRPREISQVSSSFPYAGSSGPSYLSRNQGPRRGPQEAGGVRRRQPAAGGNVQTSRTPTRQREISQVSASFPYSGSLGPPSRPREISQASAYSIPSGPPQPPQGRGRRTRQFSEPTLYSPYGQRPFKPSQHPPGWRQGTGGTSRPPANQYTYPSRPPSRPREISGVSANMPYYQHPVRPTKQPQRRMPPPNQYTEPPRRPPQEYSYTSAPYPYYQQPTRPYQLPGYSPYPIYTTDQWGRPIPYPSPYPEPYTPPLVEKSSMQSEDEDEVDESKLPFDYPPATFTGFRELSFGKAFLMLLLWLPRFFIPWISGWHEFNVYILSNPWHWKDREGDLLQQKIYLLVGRSIIAILSSVFVDLIRTRCELEYYVYLVLLVLFTLSPVSGGSLDVLLRAQFLDVKLYKDQWFLSFMLTQWAISVAFMMFPVQMACVYSQTSTMSRNAHYNWTSLFVLLEFVNAFIAFLVIPGTCPTQDWTQIVVWTGIGLLLVTVTMLTLIFLFAVRALKYAMMTCCKKEDVPAELDVDTLEDYPTGVKWKKLKWFSMIALPIILIGFSLGVLEQFVPFDDWDSHNLSSTLAVFLFWKILGVIVMVVLMIVVRKVYVKEKMPSLKIEMLFLGVPHVLYILALAIIVGRFTTLSHLKEGETIVGPIPNNDRAVLVFVNSMFRNWTICIRSQYFRPVKIRPYQHVTRELYDIAVDNFTVTMEGDPCFKPAIRTRLQVNNIKKGEWKVYDVALLYMNLTESDTWDYYRTLYAYTLRDEGSVRPKVGAPQVVIFQVSSLAPPEYWYYQMNHSQLGSLAVKTNNSAWSNLGFARNIILWEPPATGNWTVKLWSNLYNKSGEAYAWATNCSQCVSPLEFEVENNSLYLLVEYYYEETVSFSLNITTFDHPPPDQQFPMYPLSYSIFKLGEVAGPNSERLPSKKELQKDWVVKISMALAGMAAGGIFLGLVYLLWVDPPMPRYRTTTLAICWVLMGSAAALPRVILIDVGVKESIALLCLQIVTTSLHFVGAYFMYTPDYDFRVRPD